MKPCLMNLSIDTKGSKYTWHVFVKVRTIRLPRYLIAFYLVIGKDIEEEVWTHPRS